MITVFFKELSLLRSDNLCRESYNAEASHGRCQLRRVSGDSPIAPVFALHVSLHCCRNYCNSLAVTGLAS